MRVMQKGLMAALLLGSAFASAAAADSFPQRPVTIVVPFTPGGAIGIQSVARAKPDGYTLLLGSVGPVTVNPSLGPVGYDVAKELAPVVLLAKTPAVLVTLPSAPVDDVAQFVKQAKAQPGGLNYGSAGTGNITHLVSEYFLSSAGLAANHIPYKGSAPAITDMLGGRLDFMFDVVPTAQPLIKSGKYKALAVTTIKRSDVLPDVPTLDELGYKGFDVSSWFSLMAPAGTPDAVIGQINAAVNEVLRSDASRERLAAIGAYSAGGTPEQLGEFVRSETARWKKLIDERGIRAN
ncbi:Bug family tripartite tricarboxylate transporter substrate binding protein [Bordetella pertussis]|uniref:Bug family tripartite tricarboxylate transporter substrate binding protein n=1 Tax=Bordetella pertussis TaxID=520 RepID=UPI0005E7DFD0|nr:lipoprotein [Bordetella pertussis]